MSVTCEAELNRALDEAVASVLRRVGGKGPPFDAIEIARRLGYEVLWNDGENGRARVARVSGGRGSRPRPAIFLRPEPRRERVEWAVAHEIGEQCAADVCRRLGIDPTESNAVYREQIANSLATRLLLPSKWFVRDAAALDFDLLQLKGRYSTASHELIARRMLDLPTPALVTIFDHGKPQFRRWNRMNRPPSLSPLELQCWRRAHESGDVIQRREPLRIDVWPIHEPDWKREIIRLELDDDRDQFEPAD